MDDTLLDSLLTLATGHDEGAAAPTPGMRVLLRLGLRNGQIVEGELLSAQQYLYSLDRVTPEDLPPIEWADDDGLVHLDRVTYGDAGRTYGPSAAPGAIQLHRNDIVTTQVIGIGPR
ncbi:hypothetical protein DVS28_b0014 (plasmid) [Euzebya pacifica]|uniref:Uncharacterized protein n=1 Tax=Euzebya pacifica TaxID=1608957 RepID=A0A346Y5N7_9ACTN|nr:hypothetical protein [Euzebya pacifica]AXV09784.1 hypothetical protein DVS28_b0014 [Euzebya pacifica]